MKDERERPGLSRRHVLALAPVAGAAALPTTAVADEPAPRDEDPREVRLRDTEHIRTYYRLARS